jgi:thioredoxin-related protein
MNGQWKREVCYYMNILKKHFDQHKHIIIIIHAKFALDLVTIDWSPNPHMSSQHNKNMTTSNFDTLEIFHILIILKLHGLRVYE